MANELYKKHKEAHAKELKEWRENNVVKSVEPSILAKGKTPEERAQELQQGKEIAYGIDRNRRLELAERYSSSNDKLQVNGLVALDFIIYLLATRGLETPSDLPSERPWWNAYIAVLKDRGGLISFVQDAIRQGSIVPRNAVTRVPISIEGNRLQAWLRTIAQLPTDLYVFLDDVEKWAVDSRIASKGELSALIKAHQAAPNNEPSGSTGAWTEEARKIADECFDRDTASGCRDSLKGYSKRVMETMQERGIHGVRGLIDNPNYVMREALQGKKWWANKAK